MQHRAQLGKAKGLQGDYMQIPKINPNHRRRVPKRRNVTRITPKARNEVYERVGMRKCERCGRTFAYAFEVSHLEQASQGGRGDDPANLVLLCGPSVNTNTCHWWIDSTKEGREWAMEKRKELIEYYGSRTDSTAT